MCSWTTTHDARQQALCVSSRLLKSCSKYLNSFTPKQNNSFTHNYCFSACFVLFVCSCVNVCVVVCVCCLVWLSVFQCLFFVQTHFFFSISIPISLVFETKHIRKHNNMFIWITTHDVRTTERDVRTTNMFVSKRWFASFPNKTLFVSNALFVPTPIAPFGNCCFQRQQHV